MRMSAEFLRHQLLDIARRHHARVYHLGRKDRLYPEVLEALAYAQDVTKNNDSHVFNVALDYGGRDEMARAVARMVEARKTAAPDAELELTDFLDTQGQPYPEPDIVIRSSGEHRMSGFLPMQTVYSELFFVEQMFPEMTFECIRDVAEQFRWRKRRFGG
jgi:undecaprenyl diphosphate synthase